MKNKVIIGVLMLSALSFGAMKDGENSGKEKLGRKEKREQSEKMMSKLSEAQREEFTELMENKKKESHAKRLDIKEKEIVLEKELAKDQIDWESVEKTNKEISMMKGEMILENLKFRDEVEKKYGIKMKHNMGRREKRK